MARQMIARRLVALGITGTLLLGAACGGSDTKVVNEAAAPTVSGTAAAAVPASAAPTVQSRQFTDATGKAFTVEKPPTRVVALSPSVVEVMYAVGAPPIARPSSANQPEAAKSLPTIGSSYQVNVEEVVAQNPDFVVADAQIQSPQVIAQIAKIGVPVFSLRVQNVDDVIKSFRTVGGIMGKAEQGEKQAKDLEAKLQAIQAKLPPQAERPTVFVMVGTADAFWGAKPDSFSGDVVARLGAKNLVTEGADTAQFPGFTTYSLERLAALDPDVILVISVAGPNAPPTSRQLANNPAWTGLRAVKTGRVQEVPADVLVQSAGPRVSGVIDTLAPVLYPGRF